MGWWRKISGAQAAKDAAKAQTAAGGDAIDTLKESLGIARGDLQPYREAGETALNQFTTLAQDPQAQFDIANDNPLFQEMLGFERTAQAPNFDASALTNFDPIRDNPLLAMAMDETSRRMSETQAAQGRFDSGSTLVDLNKALAMTANSLANDEFGRRQRGFQADSLAESANFDNAVLQDNQTFNDLLTRVATQQGLVTDTFNRFGTLAASGLNAAAGSAVAAQNTGSQVSQTQLGIGNAQAAGLVGANNASKSFAMDLAKLAAEVYTGGAAKKAAAE